MGYQCSVLSWKMPREVPGLIRWIILKKNGGYAKGNRGRFFDESIEKAEKIIMGF